MKANKPRIAVFDFKKDWHLVEPHLNDPEVVELLNKGMLDYSKSRKYHNPPIWDPSKGIGPWAYSPFDGHVEYANEQANDDPENDALNERISRKCIEAGFSPEELFEENPDLDDHVKSIKEQLREEDSREWAKIEEKYYPKPNTYKWYQVFGGACYLKKWHIALAKKIFPKYEWRAFEKESPERDGYYRVTQIGKGLKGDFLIFDILQFEYPVEYILEGIALTQGSLDAEWSRRDKIKDDIMITWLESLDPSQFQEGLDKLKETVHVYSDEEMGEICDRLDAIFKVLWDAESFGRHYEEFEEQPPKKASTGKVVKFPKH